MSQRRYKRKKLTKAQRLKRKIIAYIARAIFLILVVGMLALMGCGCLYIYEHFIQKEEIDATKTNNEVNDTNADHTDGEPIIDSAETLVIPSPSFALSDASGISVILDAGHGGGDGGTTNGNAIEKDINLAVVLKLKTLLENNGAKVYLTRDSDKRLSLSDRTYIGNSTSAKLFVSIHCNSVDGNESVSGMECYYHPKSDSSKKCAELFLETAKNIGDIETRYTMAQNFQVLRDSSMSAILIEMGYLSNLNDRQRLTNDDYQTLIAYTIAEGIIQSQKN